MANLDGIRTSNVYAVVECLQHVSIAKLFAPLMIPQKQEHEQQAIIT